MDCQGDCSLDYLIIFLRKLNINILTGYKYQFYLWLICLVPVSFHITGSYITFQNRYNNALQCTTHLSHWEFMDLHMPWSREVESKKESEWQYNHNFFIVHFMWLKRLFKNTKWSFICPRKCYYYKANFYSDL